MSKELIAYARRPVLYMPHLDGLTARVGESESRIRVVAATARSFADGEAYFQPKETLRGTQPVFIAGLRPVPHRDNDLALFMCALDALARVDVGTVSVFLTHFSDPNHRDFQTLMGWMQQYRRRSEGETFRLYTVDFPDPPRRTRESDRKFRRLLLTATLQGRTVVSLPWNDLSTRNLFAVYLGEHRENWGLEYLAALPQHLPEAWSMARKIFGRGGKERVLPVRLDFRKSGRLRSARIPRRPPSGNGVLFAERPIFSRSVYVMGSALRDAGAGEVSLAAVHPVFLAEVPYYTGRGSPFARLVTTDSLGQELLDREGARTFGVSHVHLVSVAPLIASTIRRLVGAEAPR